MTRDEARKAAEVMMHYADGGEVKTSFGPRGAPVFNWDSSTYEIYTPPSVQASVNWDHVADEWVCHATDKKGITFFYTEAPTQLSILWAGDCILATIFASFKPGTGVDWKDSLVWRPGCKP